MATAGTVAGQQHGDENGNGKEPVNANGSFTTRNMTMRMNQAFESKYLKVDSDEIPSDGDVALTIRDLQLNMLKRDDGTDEQKPILFFEEYEAGMVLNKTNWNRIAQALGSDDSDDWIGRQVSVYSEDVEFGGKMTRGIRIRPRAPRAPQPQAAPQRPGPARPAPQRAAAPQRPQPQRMPAADPNLPPAGGYSDPAEDDVPFLSPFTGDEHLTNTGGDPIA